MSLLLDVNTSCNGGGRSKTAVTGDKPEKRADSGAIMPNQTWVESQSILTQNLSIRRLSYRVSETGVGVRNPLAFLASIHSRVLLSEEPRVCRMRNRAFIVEENVPRVDPVFVMNAEVAAARLLPTTDEPSLLHDFDQLWKAGAATKPVAVLTALVCVLVNLLVLVFDPWYYSVIVLLFTKLLMSGKMPPKLMVCLFVPIYEEVFKFYFSGGMYYPLMELLTSREMGMVRLIPFYFHYALYLLPFYARIPLHCLWNWLWLYHGSRLVASMGGYDADDEKTCNLPEDIFPWVWHQKEDTRRSRGRMMVKSLSESDARHIFHVFTCGEHKRYRLDFFRFLDGEVPLSRFPRQMRMKLFKVGEDRQVIAFLKSLCGTVSQTGFRDIVTFWQSIGTMAKEINLLSGHVHNINVVLDMLNKDTFCALLGFHDLCLLASSRNQSPSLYASSIGRIVMTDFFKTMLAIGGDQVKEMMETDIAPPTPSPVLASPVPDEVGEISQAGLTSLTFRDKCGALLAAFLSSSIFGMSPVALQFGIAVMVDKFRSHAQTLSFCALLPEIIYEALSRITEMLKTGDFSALWRGDDPVENITRECEARVVSMMSFTSVANSVEFTSYVADQAKFRVKLSTCLSQKKYSSNVLLKRSETKFYDAYDALTKLAPMYSKIGEIETYVAVLRSGERTVFTDDPEKYGELLLFRESITKLASQNDYKKNPLFVKSVSNFMEAFESFLLAKRDGPPLKTVGIIMTGPPGVGKSSFEHVLAAGVRKRRNLPESVPVVVRYQEDAKHQKPVPTASMLVWEDAFCTKDEKCEAPTLALLQRFVEGHAVELSGASLEEKAISSVNLDVVFINTNAEKIEATQSSSGFDKGDRRYLITKKEHTKELLEFCQARQIEPSRYLAWRSSAAYDGSRDGCADFLYTAGRMKNSPTGRVISFEIKTVLFTTTSDSEFEAWINAWIVSEQAVKIPSEETCHRCAHGTPSEVDNECSSLCVKMRESFTPTRETSQGMLDGLRSLLRVEEVSPSVALASGMFVWFKMQSVVIMEMFRWVGQNSGMFALNVYLTTMILMTVVFQTVAYGVRMVRSFAPEPQAYAQRPISGFEKDVPDVSVDHYRRNLPSYVGIRPDIRSSILEVRVGRMSVKTIMITPEVGIVPMHLFYRPRSGVITLPRYDDVCCEEGTLVELIRGSTITPFKFAMKCVEVIGDRLFDDICLYFFGTMPSAPLGVYSLIGCPDVVSNGKFKGRNCQFMRNSNVLHMAGECYPGDCGEPYESVDGALMGVHVRGNVSEAHGSGPVLSKIACREALDRFDKKGLITLTYSNEVAHGVDELMEKCGDVTPPGDVAQVVMRMTPEERILSDVNVLGKLRFPDRARMTAKPSTIAEHFAELNLWKWRGPHDGHALESCGFVSPITKRLDHPGGHHFPISDEILPRLFPDLETIPCKPLSWAQTCAGDPRNSLMGPVPLDTALGYQARFLGLTKKTAFSKNELGGTHVHEKMVKLAWDEEARLSRREGCLHVIEGNLKNEVLDAKKVEVDAGGRLFFVIGKEYNMVAKKYCRQATAFLGSHWRRTGFSHAINPAGSDWAEMRAFHLAIGRFCFDGDFRSYDVSHGAHTAFLYQFFKFLRMLGATVDEAVKACRAILDSTRGIVKMEGFLLLMCCRLFSGLDITLVYNGFVNMLLLASWLLEAEQESGMQVDLVHEMRQDKVGDDFIMSLADRLAESEFFSPERYRLFLARHGYTMTAADKGVSVLRWKTFDECQFLKRRTSQPLPGVYVGALEKKSIIKALTATLEKVATRERDLAAWQSMEKEAFLHGVEYCRTLQECARKASLPCREISKMSEDLLANKFCLWENEPVLDVQEEIQQGVLKESDPGMRISRGRWLFILSASIQMCALLIGSCFNFFPTKEATLIDEFKWEPNSNGFGRPFVVALCPALNSTTEEVHEMESVKLSTYSDIGGLGSDRCNFDAPYPPYTAPPLDYPLKDFCAVKRRIATYDWDTGLAHFQVGLFMEWIALPVVSNYLQGVSRFRGKPRVNLRYTGSSAYQGMLRAYFTPKRFADADANAMATFLVQDAIPAEAISKHAGYPHVDLDVTKPIDCTILLPYISQEDYFYSTLAANDDWILHLQPLVPLESAYGLTVVPIKLEVWVSYDDVEAISLTSQGDDGGGVISRALHYASMFTSAYSAPIGMVLKLGSVVASKMGYSRDPDAIEHQIVMRDGSAWSTTSGEGAGTYVLALDYRSAKSQDTRALPMGINDYADFIRKTNQVSSDFVAGTQLAIGPDVVFDYYSKYYPSPLNIVTLLHERWSGSMRVKLQFVSSPLIRTRVGINVLAPGEPLATSFISDGRAIAKEVDVIGTTEVYIDVPWMYSTTSVATSMMSPSTLGIRPIIVWFALSGPSGPSETAIAPRCMVFVEPGDDFDFAHPTSSVMNSFFVIQGRLQDLEGEASTSFKQLGQRRTFVGTITPGSNGADGLKGFNYPRAGMSLNYGNNTVFGPEGYKYVIDNPQWSFHRLIMSFTYCYSGGNVWSVLMRDQEDAHNTVKRPLAVGLTRSGYNSAVPTLAGSYWTSRGDGSQSVCHGSIDVTIPDRMGSRFTYSGISSCAQIDGDPEPIMPCMLVGTYPVATSYQVDMIHAAASDVQYGMYMPPTWVRIE